MRILNCPMINASHHYEGGERLWRASVTLPDGQKFTGSARLTQSAAVHAAIEAFEGMSLAEPFAEHFDKIVQLLVRINAGAEAMASHIRRSNSSDAIRDQFPEAEASIHPAREGVEWNCSELEVAMRNLAQDDEAVALFNHPICDLAEWTIWEARRVCEQVLSKIPAECAV